MPYAAQLWSLCRDSSLHWLPSLLHSKDVLRLSISASQDDKVLTRDIWVVVLGDIASHLLRSSSMCYLCVHNWLGGLTECCWLWGLLTVTESVTQTASHWCMNKFSPALPIRRLVMAGYDSMKRKRSRQAIQSLFVQIMMFPRLIAINTININSKSIKIIN